MIELFLILDLTDFGNWPSAHVGDEALARSEQPLRIPQGSRPTVLQMSRPAAEREVLRLAARYPSANFALLEVTHVTVSVPTATHVNLNGMALRTDMVRRLMPVKPTRPVDGDDIPF